ncbi:pumilio RNA-binding family [Enteropsectra breve]|nr:pumilio RNA-binding family [Enteropsectra breve]
MSGRNSSCEQLNSSCDERCNRPLYATGASHHMAKNESGAVPKEKSAKNSKNRTKSAVDYNLDWDSSVSSEGFIYNKNYMQNESGLYIYRSNVLYKLNPFNQCYYEISEKNLELLLAKEKESAELKFYSECKELGGRMDLKPRPIMENQIGSWPVEYNDCFNNAFKPKKTIVDMINYDHPNTEACMMFDGVRDTTKAPTPIGDISPVDPNFFKTSSPIKHVPASVSPLRRMESHQHMAEIKKFYDGLHPENPTIDAHTLCLAVAKDQDGSRFIQALIEKWKPEQISFLFNQIFNDVQELSINLFGNYVIQKLIPALSADELEIMKTKFYGHVYSLSVHIYGCRVIQRLIDSLEDIGFIVRELEGHTSELIASPNGNHVVQKCIEKSGDRCFIIKDFEQNCIELAQQRYGCRVLQRLFEVCREEDMWNIYLQIIEHIDELINDKYGNYVIQHLIQTENRKRGEIFDHIIRSSYYLSKHKFSSNVIEKCVNNSTPAQLEAFMEEFAKSEDGKRPYLFYMCIDMYANYVVQRFLDIASVEMKNKAKTILKPYVKEMKLIPFTKHILTKLYDL